MKYILNSFVLYSCLGLSQFAVAADLSLSASSLKLKVYKMAVSTSVLCTNLITVLDNGNTPTELDFLSNPNLGSGTIADGTYPCIVIEFTDNIKFIPSTNSTSGNCLTSAEYTLDICRPDSGGTSRLIDGTTTTCTGVTGGALGPDRVALYLSTTVVGSSGDSFNPPTTVGDTGFGLRLGSALTVSGTTSGKFIVNPTGKVCDTANPACGGGGASCELDAPDFSFSKL